MKRLHVTAAITGRDVLAILAAEQSLLAAMPIGARIIHLKDVLPGAETLNLYSGCRIVVQHDINRDTDNVFLQLQFESLGT